MILELATRYRYFALCFEGRIAHLYPQVDAKFDRKITRMYSEISRFIEYQTEVINALGIFAVVLVRNPAPGVPHPFGGLERAWTWLAKIVNVKPTEESPAVLQKVLQVTSFHLLKQYPKQFPKLIRCLGTAYCPLFAEGLKQPYIRSASSQLYLMVDSFNKNKLFPQFDVFQID